MIMKELYAQLGISSAVYDFGKTVEDSQSNGKYAKYSI